MSRLKQVGKRLLLPVLIFVLWAMLCWQNVFSSYVLPGPWKVAATFWDMLASGQLLIHIGVSFGRVLVGFAIAFALSFVLGVLTGLIKEQAVYYSHILEFMRQVPPLSLIPILILWFGIGETSKIIIIILAAFYPMLLNTQKGVSGCSPKLLEVGTIFELSLWEKFYKIILPSAIPDILIGMRIGLGYSWRAIIGAEMIAASQGLGYLILDAQQMSRSDKVIVGILSIGLVGILCDKVFGALIKCYVHGGIADGNISG